MWESSELTSAFESFTSFLGLSLVCGFTKEVDLNSGYSHLEHWR